MENLISVKNLYKKFPKHKDFLGKPNGFVYALNGIDLDIYKNETLGIVGESGCGKSTFGRCLLRLTEPDKGEILFKNENLLSLKNKELKSIRKDLQIIFQNPYSSLNPRMNIHDILAEPLKLNTNLKTNEIDKRINQTLDMVELPENVQNNFPHEFSGGQRQRIVIAKALILKPEFIVADEPISALDISIQAQIIKLLKTLKSELGLTYLFISHDLSTVEHFCDRTAVMYLGEIVEIADTKELFNNPKHPYTKMLLKSIPKIDFNKEITIEGIEGEPVSNEKILSSCKFAQRCKLATKKCFTNKPDNILISNTHNVKCFLYE